MLGQTWRLISKASSKLLFYPLNVLYIFFVVLVLFKLDLWCITITIDSCHSHLKTRLQRDDVRQKIQR